MIKTIQKGANFQVLNQIATYAEQFQETVKIEARPLLSHQFYNVVEEAPRLEQFAFWTAIRSLSERDHVDRAWFVRSAFVEGRASYLETNQRENVMALALWDVRNEYLDFLLTFEDYPHFDRKGIDIDEEMKLLLFDDIGKVLAIQIEGFSTEQVTLRNRSKVEKMVVEFLLPRYMLCESWRAAWWSLEAKRRGLVAVPLGLAITTFSTSVASTAGLPAHWMPSASWLAVLAVFFTLFAAIAGGALTMHSLCIRLLASCGVGQAIVAAFLTSDSVFALTKGTDEPTYWRSSAVLAGFVLVYLLVESGLHRVTIKESFGRIVPVALLGGAYAWSLGSIVVGLVLPEFRTKPWVGQLIGRSYVSMTLTVALAGLLVGLLTQVLWDDRPITAPLGRKSWRSVQ